MPLTDKLIGRSPGELRDEREQIGFVRQPAVRWLSPAVLVRAGVEVLVSGAFGKFADKREIQREAQDGLDHSAAGELWVDYLSDTGDGWPATYTMAWLLAQERLEYEGQALPRGKVLLLGGDQVYPTADPVAYEDRFIGPFASALPSSPEDDAPELYALPGNHDWYDGLVSFLRVFATGGWIGGWKTRQRRGYFAIKLPNDWWVWAIDIQLDTYIDEVQLEYFRGLPVRAGDKVILLTAKPAWVKAVPGRVEPESWRYLSFFEERVVQAAGARLVMTITGDVHHYARYEPAGEGADAEPTRITAGGGGAYLSGTHTLPPELQLRSLGTEADETVSYALEEVYPRPKDSRRLSVGILRLALLNPSFARLLGVIYVVLGFAMLAAINSGDLGFVTASTGVATFLGESFGGATVVIVALLFGAIVGGTDIVAQPLEKRAGVERATKLARLGVAALHTLAHLAIAALALWVVLQLVADEPLLVWAAGAVVLFAAGTALGATLFGVSLFAIHRIRGGKAWSNANQVFTGQSIPDYKNLLRMHFAADGSLTIYPLGVDRTGREWDHTPEASPGPTFSPRGERPVAHAIDVPLRYDATGRRAH